MTSQEILSEFGLDQKELKAAERELLRTDSALKGKYSIRLFSLMAAFIVTRLISVQLFPEMPWFLHFVTGLAAVLGLWVTLTKNVTNPALAEALRRLVVASNEVSIEEAVGE